MASVHPDFVIPTTVLLDANNLAMRCYHAAKHTGMSSGGEHTGALLLFINSLAKHVALQKPDYFVACWDGGGSKYREELYPQYKSARKAASGGAQAHAESFRLIKAFLDLNGIGQERREGVEADDLIAAFHRRSDGDIVILSSDKDLLQLVDLMTIQVRFSGDLHDDVWNHSRVVSEFGCEPEQLPLYMALMGDQSDSIPGVPGIGPKKALKLLQEHDWDWERVLESFDMANALYAETSRALVDLSFIDTTVSRVPSWNPVVRIGRDEPRSLPAYQSLVKFCRDFELDTVMQRITTNTLWV